MQQAQQVRLALDELIRRLLRVREQRIQVLQRVVGVAGIVNELVRRDLHVEAAQVAWDFLHHLQEGGGDVPEGRELDLDAADDVGFDDVVEGLEALERLPLERELAVAAVFGEEGFGFGELGFVARLLVGQDDDGFVFVVALAEEVVDFAVELLARFEEPFELGQFLEELGLLVAFLLREVRASFLGVAEETAAELVEGCRCFGDLFGEAGMKGADDGSLEFIEFRLFALLFFL